jgi:hypothetical protein
MHNHAYEMSFASAASTSFEYIAHQLQTVSRNTDSGIVPNTPTKCRHDMVPFWSAKYAQHISDVVVHSPQTFARCIRSTIPCAMQRLLPRHTPQPDAQKPVGFTQRLWCTFSGRERSRTTWNSITAKQNWQ